MQSASAPASAPLPPPLTLKLPKPEPEPTHSNPIPFLKFEDYVESKILEIQVDFLQLDPPDKKLKSSEVSETKSNLGKHRYPDLLTYEHTRVRLNETEFTESDEFFIAANWVSGIRDADPSPKRYIATQCPTSETLDDFYRMIWEHGVQQVVNLASPRDFESGKAYTYYPDEECLQTGQIQVRLVNKDESFLPDVVVRRYELRKNDDEPEVRTLTHFHFQSWPDRGVPEDPKQILNLINVCRADSLFSADQPLVVHCLAGVGRSGTFILTDSMYELCSDAQATHLDFLAHLWKIRNERISLVETAKQYLFAHRVIALHLSESSR